MKRAMTLRQARSPRVDARPSGSIPPLYPQLDMQRFFGGLGLHGSVPAQPGTSAGQDEYRGEPTRSLKDALGRSRQKPAAIFGIGLGIAAQDVIAPPTPERRMGEPFMAQEPPGWPDDEQALSEEEMVAAAEEELQEGRQYMVEAERRRVLEKLERQEAEEALEGYEKEGLEEDVFATEEEQEGAAGVGRTGEAGDRDRDPVSPPWSPLPFNISREEFDAARTAPAGSPESFWSFEMYRGPASGSPAARVKDVYCDTAEQMERECQHFLAEPVIALDMEWMMRARSDSSAREYLSLIQIASPSRIALFHLAQFPPLSSSSSSPPHSFSTGSFFSSPSSSSSSFPNDPSHPAPSALADKHELYLATPTFRAIMADQRVTKVGVNILADCTRMRNKLGVVTRGVLELSQLYRIVKYVPERRPDLINKRLVALAAQVEDQLGLPLFKGDEVRTSNWMEVLDEDQRRYAASDVYASLQLYHVLEHKRTSLSPCPEPPLPAELREPLPIPSFHAPPSPSLTRGPDHQSLDTITADLAALALSPADALPSSHKPRAKPKSKAKFKSFSTTTTTTITNPSSSPAAALSPSDPRILAADLKAKQYRSSTPSATSGPATLRAYYLWTDYALTPKSIACLLKAPPLKTLTVVKYITDAIFTEKLPFDADRARGELFSSIPSHLRQTVSSFKAFPWHRDASSSSGERS